MEWLNLHSHSSLKGNLDTFQHANLQNVEVEFRGRRGVTFTHVLRASSCQDMSILQSKVFMSRMRYRCYKKMGSLHIYSIVIILQIFFASSLGFILILVTRVHVTFDRSVAKRWCQQWSKIQANLLRLFHLMKSGIKKSINVIPLCHVLKSDFFVFKLA